MVKTRDNYNIELIEIVKDYLLSNPRIRFCQALYNLGVIDGKDRFYEESGKTLSRVRNKIEDDGEEDFLY